MESLEEITPQRVKLTRLTIWLAGIYIVLIVTISKYVVLNSPNEIDYEDERGMMSLLFVALAIGGFVLGLLAAFIPFKKLSWSRKYLIASLFCSSLCAMTYFIYAITQIGFK